MPKQDIDVEMAALERLIDGSDQSLEKRPEKRRKKRRFPMWLAIVLVAAVIDLGARFFVPSSMPFVLKLESLIFLGAAGALAVPIFKKPKLSGFRRKLHLWLGGAFALGAIRSGLWGFGLPVQYANLTIFALAIVTFGVVYLLRRRSGRAEARDSEV